MACELKIVTCCFNTRSFHLKVPSYRFIVAVVKTCKEIKHANEILIVWDKMLSYTRMGIPYSRLRVRLNSYAKYIFLIFKHHLNYTQTVSARPLQGKEWAKIVCV